MNLQDLYLIAYNLGCCLGWAVVWLLAVRSLYVSMVDQGLAWDVASSQVYGNVALWLQISQSAALMEIVHAAVGLVRSPVMITAMQVMSRIIALVAIVYAPTAQGEKKIVWGCTIVCSDSYLRYTSLTHYHIQPLSTDQWGAGLMILSWASVEVPRYAFYMAALITGDSTKKTPFPLFWMRYSLFAVLYPTGIYGELTVFFKAAYDPDFLGIFGSAATIFYAYLIPTIYFFGSPGMIMNMAGNRKKAFKKRFAKPPPPPRGLVWPLDSKGERSSTAVNQGIVAAAVSAVDPALGEAIAQTRGWRFKYWKRLKEMVEVQCTSPEAALAVAKAGLEEAYKRFQFVGPDGESMSFAEAMSKPSKHKFHTHCIKGSGSKKVTQLEVPYKGQILSGQALKDQVQKWVDYGTIEPSAGEAIQKCVDNPKWITDMSDRYFVLLGAGSAMGPLLVLLSIGANVVAIDLDRPGIWKRLITLARESSGTLTFPTKVDPSTIKTDEELFAQSGCNLFTDTPTIRDWLVDLYPGKKFTVGSYAYLNGALHVQVSLAMDAISRDLTTKRKNTSLAYLCTPTDLHLIPVEAWEAAKDHYKEYSSKPYCILLQLLGRGKFLRRNAREPIPGKGGDYFLVNGISVAQGPNYALAKRMQHWRAIIARSQGCVVSSNIAPSTSTVSVTQNRTFAWAYEGMPYFKPFEIFAPETSNAVMSAILFHDLHDSSSVANPKTKISNPNQLFSYGSFHGGVWRCAYEIDSIGEASVFRYFGRLAQPYLYAAGAITAAAVGMYVAKSS